MAVRDAPGGWGWVDGVVLSISKLRVGAEAYQLTGVAQSLDDYYSGSGEAAGWWAGLGADRLGLDGDVTGEDLRELLAGIQPGTGGLSPNGETIHPHPRRVPGFDLTFKAPKSVSVLYAVSDDPRVQGAIIEASEHALRDTLAWLEREAMAVRRGTGNERFLADLALRDPAAAQAARIRTERGGEMAAAVFRHRTSRAGDPLLHWHVLVPNLVRGADGRWSAFVHPDLYRAATAAGELFQAALRDELTRTLGLEWRPGRHLPEIAGVPQRVCDGFSKRSAEIDAWLEAHGRGNDRAARQDAVLATRRGKAELEGERFDTRWKLEGAALGFGPEQADELLTGLVPTAEPTPISEVWRLPEVSIGRDGVPYTHDRTVPAEEWIADLLRHDLTTKDATFVTTDIYEAVAHRLGGGATVNTIDRIAARVLASDQVVPILSADARERWASVEMIDTERRLLDLFDQRGTRTALDHATVASVLAAHPTLGPDQANAVATITASTDPLAVLIGPAGTGKTYTLSVVREAFSASGCTVIGAAPSARAAVELEHDAGISSSTLHSLNCQWSQAGGGPDARTVLVIDEAAMASTRDLEPLVSATVAAGGRVVLVGDHHQLPEIGPGGALAAAAERVTATAELSVNRRQREPWEQSALAELRAGSVPAAVDAYRTHDRVEIVADHEAMIDAAVDRYLTAIDNGQRPVLMAGTNDLVRRLNTNVRLRLAERGQLHLDHPHATSGGRDLVEGDRIVLRRNRTLTQPDGTTVRVRNSDAATVLRAATDGGLLVRRDNDQAAIRLDRDYLNAGWVDHGYAVTAHRAQGGTWDLAIAVGVDGLYREAAYVQLSRGRDTNWLIIPTAQMEAIDAELARHDHGIPLPGEEPPETLDDLINRLQQSRAKLMALARDPHADQVAALAGTFTYSELRQRAGYCRRVEQTATRSIGIDPDNLTAAIERAQRTALHVQIGQQVKAFDRHNIGTVTGIDDTACNITVHFVSHEGHEATREFPWTEIDIVERHLPPARALPEWTQQRLDDLLDAYTATLTDWEAHHQRHGITPGDGQRCDRAAALIVDRAAHRLTVDQPDWLTTLLGPRPDGPHQAALWDHAIHTVATHRLATEVDDHIPGLGPVPVDPARRASWDNVSRQLLATRTQLDAARIALPVWPQRRTLDELEARRDELDLILDTAPPDQRDLIGRLRGGDQLTLLDTEEALAAALATQSARRDWILAHWPHVVEYAAIGRTVEAGDFAHGPEWPNNAAIVTESQPLARAIDLAEAWLQRVPIDLDQDGSLNETSIDRLEKIADYRVAWGIRSTDPLGPVPRHPAQLAQYEELARLAGIEPVAGPAVIQEHSVAEPDDRLLVSRSTPGEDFGLGIE